MARDGVLEQEFGILKKEGIWFHDTSDFAQKNLFYPKWGAEYVCAAPYAVHREYLDAYLLFYIVEGELCFTYRAKTFRAQAGQCVLLDCHLPNHYWTESHAHFQWLHFSGNVCAAYADELYAQFGACFDSQRSAAAAEQLQQLLHMMQTGEAEDHMLSCTLHQILAILTAPKKSRYSSAIFRAMQYINENYMQPVTVAQLAALSHLSEVHFSRLFLQETGRAPHEYILLLRLKYARTLLSDTDIPVEQIAEKVGFSGSTHFIRMFKKRNHFTPLQFRKLFRARGQKNQLKK